MKYQSSTTDVALIGGGIMSITLAALLAELDPNLQMTIYEVQDEVATESSNPWNNAGTGHSALCELNYTPMREDGSIDPTKAYRINEAFQISRQFWSYLVNAGTIPDPRAFLHPVPHMSLVWGQENIDFLRKRFETLKDHPLFVGMKFSDDIEQIGQWSPLLVAGRNTDPKVMEPMAATFIESGTDVNFGRLTQLLAKHLKTLPNVEFKYDTKVKNLRFDSDDWLITHSSSAFGKRYDVAHTVFVGSGGAALTLLQKSKIREVHGYGGFPISGQFLRTLKPELVAQHATKVYGKASVKAPPMSVPHLDARVVDGQHAVLFGPYAGWTPKFLKRGSLLDLFKSLRWHNLYPMVTSGLQNLGLVKYLVGEVFASQKKRLKSLQAYFPAAKLQDWELITAGQRVQIIKPKQHSKAGELVLGTEVVASQSQRIAGLLGASPGASTATAIMLEVIAELFPNRLDEWTPKIQEMIPSYGIQLADHPKLAEQLLNETADTLKIHR